LAAENHKTDALEFEFEAAVDGDDMTGVAKAGMLPASKLTGRRIR
jgi:hypothetical protein